MTQQICKNCKYYTDDHIILWGNTYKTFNVCLKQSHEGQTVYSFDESDCEEWEEKDDKDN